LWRATKRWRHQRGHHQPGMRLPVPVHWNLPAKNVPGTGTRLESISNQSCVSASSAHLDEMMSLKSRMTTSHAARPISPPMPMVQASCRIQQTVGVRARQQDVAKCHFLQEEMGKRGGQWMGTNKMLGKRSRGDGQGVWHMGAHPANSDRRQRRHAAAAYWWSGWHWQ